MRKWVVALHLLCLPVMVEAEEAAPTPDVRVAVRGDAVVNWTRLVLEVTASARGFGVESSQAVVEQEARRAVGPRMLAGARAIQVTTDDTVGDLESDARFGTAFGARIERWSVTEARYYSSGKVELLGELSLQDLLKPWTLSVALPPPVGEGDSRITGVILDARGSGLVPAFSPRIKSADGDVLYDGTLWLDEAVGTTPVVFVSDESHPSAARAGKDPLRLRADASEGSDAWLTQEDSLRFQAELKDSRVLGRGTLVVLVGP
jgi:hypothetical protein